MRAMANTLWNRWVGTDADLPNLMYPYFETSDPEELAQRMKALDGKIAEMKVDEHHHS